MINGKTLVLIDGSNTYSSLAQMGKSIDWKQFVKYYDQAFELLRIKYYTAIHEDENGQRVMQKLVDFLSYNGFSVVTKPTKTYAQNGKSDKVKGNMDIEIACDMISLASKVDNIILYSGDNDFCYAVNLVQQMGVWVQAVSLRDVSRYPGANQTMGDGLRRQVDSFIDLGDMINSFEQTTRRNVFEESKTNV